MKFSSIIADIPESYLSWFFQILYIEREAVEIKVLAREKLKWLGSSCEQPGREAIKHFTYLFDRGERRSCEIQFGTFPPGDKAPCPLIDSHQYLAQKRMVNITLCSHALVWGS